MIPNRNGFFFGMLLLIFLGCTPNQSGSSSSILETTGPGNSMAPEPSMSASETVAPTSPKAESHYLGRDRPDRMLKLTLKQTDQGIEVLDRLEAPNTMNRRSPHEKRRTFFRVFDADGKVLLERGFRLETSVRSETTGPDGTIEGHHLEIEQPVFSIAVPLYEDLDVIRIFEAVADGTRDNATLLGEVRP